MKRALMLFMLLGLVVGLLAITGCGGKKTTIETPEGEITVGQEGGEATYETGEGQVTVKEGEGESTVANGEGAITSSDKPPTEEQLGAPIYPDAGYVPGSGGTASATGAEGQFTTAGGEWTTKDAYDKVVSWYKGKLGNPTYEETSTKKTTWMISEGEESFSVVTVSVENGEVKISIGRMAGTNVGK